MNNTLVNKLIAERDRNIAYLEEIGTPKVEVLAYSAGMNKAIAVCKTADNLPRMERGKS